MWRMEQVVVKLNIIKMHVTPWGITSKLSVIVNHTTICKAIQESAMLEGNTHEHLV